jgi:hypothetical protein
VRPYIEYDGYKFIKDISGYYIGPRRICRENLHRYKYKKEVGEIPQGHIIHHIDCDKENNNVENLQCMSQSEHIKLHDIAHNENTLITLRKKWSGNKNPWYGKPRSGKDNPMYGCEVSEYRKKKTSEANSRKVICVDTGKIYKSIKSAFDETGIHNISAVCRGVNNKAGGLKWAYYEGGTPSLQL